MSRENQKRRTRRAIVTAAAELLRSGRQPTVAEVADAAEVSRATAYSYFPNREALIEEAALELAEQSRIDAALDSAWEGCGDDLIRRWRVFCPVYFNLFRRNEAVYRSMLRTQQERWLDAHSRGGSGSVVVRQARRLPIIDRLLAPARATVAPAAYRQLADGLALVAGIEPLVVLQDICGLTFDEAVERLDWAGRALIAATVSVA